MPTPVVGPQRRTHPLIWCVAILCTLITVAVIIAGVAVFVGYLIIRPKVPQISVASAQLDRIDYDQAGILAVRIIIFLRAENDNARAHATFYDANFILSFHGVKIAYLQAHDPINLRKKSSVELKFVVESYPITLDPEEQDSVAAALNQNALDFDLKGTTRTRWRVGLLGSVKFSLHLDCRLQLPRNYDIIYPRCSSKSR